MAVNLADIYYDLNRLGRSSLEAIAQHIDRLLKGLPPGDAAVLFALCDRGAQHRAEVSCFKVYGLNTLSDGTLRAEISEVDHQHTLRAAEGTFYLVTGKGGYGAVSTQLAVLLQAKRGAEFACRCGFQDFSGCDVELVASTCERISPPKKTELIEEYPDLLHHLDDWLFPIYAALLKAGFEPGNRKHCVGG